MISFPLYRLGFHILWKLVVVLMILSTIYITSIIGMYRMADGFSYFIDAMPALMEAFGFMIGNGTLVSTIALQLYGMILVIIPMIFSLYAANRLVAKRVDDGSMANLVVAPVSRNKIIRTQASLLLTGITALVVYATITEIVVAQIQYPGELAIKPLLTLNLAAWCLHVFVGGVAFLFSCIFSDASRSIAYGSGIPVVSFVLNAVARSDPGTAWDNLAYVSFFSLFRNGGIVEYEDTAITGASILLGGAVILYILSVMVFNRKDLNI